MLGSRGSWKNSGRILATACNYAPKAAAAFGIPLLMVLLNLFVNFMPDKDPKTIPIMSRRLKSPPNCSNLVGFVLVG